MQIIKQEVNIFWRKIWGELEKYWQHWNIFVVWLAVLLRSGHTLAQGTWMTWNIKGDCPDNKDSKCLWNVDKFLRDYIVRYPTVRTQNLTDVKWSLCENQELISA